MSESLTEVGVLDGALAISALSALAHDGRLDVFRRLVKAGPEGLPAGEIAREVGAPPSTLSTNLAILLNAGLVTARRDGRSIIYSAAYGRMRDLIAYLMEDCCGGNAEICAPIAAVAGRCCAPAC
jgi:DNA-binding transcriptional ArsR family regulator